MLGLFGSPFRKLAIDSLRAEIPAPSHAITADFLNTLVRLAQDGTDSHPPELNRDGEKAVREYWAEQQVMTSALMKAEMEKVVAALPFKTTAVRAITLNGLVMAAGSNRPVAPTIRSALIAAWPELPPQTQ